MSKPFVLLDSFSAVYTRATHLMLKHHPELGEYVNKVDVCHGVAYEQNVKILTHIRENILKLADRNTLHEETSAFDFIQESKSLSDLQDNLSRAKKELTRKLIELGDSVSPQLQKWLDFLPHITG